MRPPRRRRPSRAGRGRAPTGGSRGVDRRRSPRSSARRAGPARSRCAVRSRRPRRSGSPTPAPRSLRSARPRRRPGAAWPEPVAAPAARAGRLLGLPAAVVVAAPSLVARRRRAGCGGGSTIRPGRSAYRADAGFARRARPRRGSSSDARAGSAHPRPRRRPARSPASRRQPRRRRPDRLRQDRRLRHPRPARVARARSSPRRSRPTSSTPRIAHRRRRGTVWIYDPDRTVRRRRPARRGRRSPAATTGAAPCALAAWMAEAAQPPQRHRRPTATTGTPRPARASPPTSTPPPSTGADHGRRRPLDRHPERRRGREPSSQRDVGAPKRRQASPPIEARPSYDARWDDIQDARSSTSFRRHARRRRRDDRGRPGRVAARSTSGRVDLVDDVADAVEAEWQAELANARAAIPARPLVAGAGAVGQGAEAARLGVRHHRERPRGWADPASARSPDPTGTTSTSTSGCTATTRSSSSPPPTSRRGCGPSSPCSSSRRSARAYDIASRPPGGRLPHPCLVLLDEAGNIAPLPGPARLRVDRPQPRHHPRHRLAGPRPDHGDLRRPGPDRAQQPPGQALRHRHRRRDHPRVRQPPHRRRAPDRAQRLRRPARRPALRQRAPHLPAGRARRRHPPHRPERGRPHLRLRAARPGAAAPVVRRAPAARHRRPARRRSPATREVDHAHLRRNRRPDDRPTHRRHHRPSRAARGRRDRRLPRRARRGLHHPAPRPAAPRPRTAGPGPRTQARAARSHPRRRPHPVARPLAHRGAPLTRRLRLGLRRQRPADLAYAILHRELAEEVPAAVYLPFRDQVVARLPADGFRLPATDVWDWIRANRALVDRRSSASSPTSPSSPSSTPRLPVRRRRDHREDPTELDRPDRQQARRRLRVGLGGHPHADTPSCPRSSSSSAPASSGAGS